jgi:hypothetical protein
MAANAIGAHFSMKLQKYWARWRRFLSAPYEHYMPLGRPEVGQHRRLIAFSR